MIYSLIRAQLKVLYSSEVTFVDRIYTAFDADLKLIKMRESLDSLTSHPDIYMRDKVSEDVCTTLLKLAELKRGLRMRQLKAMSLFPVPEHLLTVERKYGESLTDEDIYGAPEPQPQQKATPTVLQGWLHSIMLC